MMIACLLNKATFSMSSDLMYLTNGICRSPGTILCCKWRLLSFLPALCHSSVPTLSSGPRRRFYVLAQKIVSTATGQLDFLITYFHDFYHLVMTHVSNCQLIASKKGSRSSKSLSFLLALRHFSQVPTLSSGPRISSYHPPSTSKRIRTTFSMGLNNNDHHPWSNSWI